jgi:large subunit ribosomal protein L25
MAEVTLTVESGRVIGSRSSGRLRTEGKIPAVLYGHGMQPVSFAVDRRALRAALHTEAGHNAVVDLSLDGSAHLAIVKELQRHPVRNEVIHVDFLAVNRDEVVTVEVPVVLEGEATAVHLQNGTVDQQLFSLTMHAKPGDIPNSIVVDISGLSIGDAIRIGDLTLPAGATTDVDLEDVVVVAQSTRAGIEGEEDEATTGEAAEGDEPTAEAEGDGAEGSAAEAGGNAAEGGDSTEE